MGCALDRLIEAILTSLFYNFTMRTIHRIKLPYNNNKYLMLILAKVNRLCSWGTNDKIRQRIYIYIDKKSGIMLCQTVKRICTCLMLILAKVNRLCSWGTNDKIRQRIYIYI